MDRANATLASLMMLIERPTAGRILYKGRDIFGFSRREATTYRFRCRHCGTDLSYSDSA